MLNGSRGLSRSETAVTESSGDEQFVYDMATGKVFVFRGVGALIWDLLDGRHSPESITEAVVTRFQVSHATARQDTVSFVAQLTAEGLLGQPFLRPPESARMAGPPRRPKKRNEIHVDLGLGPGLALRLEGWPEWYRMPVRAFLDQRNAGRWPTDSGNPLLWTYESMPPGTAEAPEEILRDGLLTVLFFRSHIEYELPGIRGWCDFRSSRAGVTIEDPDSDSWMVFLSRIVPMTLMEMAWPRAWIGLHAAAVAYRRRAIVLPAPSGSGKSTIYQNAHDAGLDVLSDDLVWIRRELDEFRVVAFPRGTPMTPMPGPTDDDLPLSAWVLPGIAGQWHNNLSPVPVADIVRALIGESTILARRSITRTRFPELILAAGAAPGFRLDAGHYQFGAVRLLRRLGEHFDSADHRR